MNLKESLELIKKAKEVKKEFFQMLIDDDDIRSLMYIPSGDPLFISLDNNKLHMRFTCICGITSQQMLNGVNKLKNEFGVDEVVAYYPYGHEQEVAVLTEEECHEK